MSADVPQSLFASADPLLLDHDFKHHRAWLLPMSREDYAEASFLDARIGERVREAVPVPIATLHRARGAWLAASGARPKPLRFIFHTAFCASTLLARCLDHPGSTLALREPMCLHRVSGMQRNRRADPEVAKAVPSERYEALLSLTLDMLSRTFVDGEVPIVKPTDSTNHIAVRCVEHRPGSRAILLYAALDWFVVSCLKAHVRREYVRHLLWRARTDGAWLGVLDGVDLPEDPALTDAQVAAMVWAVQMRTYRALVGSLEGAARTLDAADLVADPGRVLRAAASFLDLPLGDAHIDGALATTMRQHAKVTSSTYTPEDAAAERRALAARFASEIDEARSFAEPILGPDGMGLPESAALCG